MLNFKSGYIKVRCPGQSDQYFRTSQQNYSDLSEHCPLSFDEQTCEQSYEEDWFDLVFVFEVFFSLPFFRGRIQHAKS